MLLNIKQYHILLYDISSCGYTIIDLTDPQFLGTSVISNYTIINNSTTVSVNTHCASVLSAPQDKSQKWKSWAKRIEHKRLNLKALHPL